MLKNIISKKLSRKRFAAVLLSAVFTFSEGSTCLVYAASNNDVVQDGSNYVINKFEMLDENIASQKLQEDSPESLIQFPQSLIAEVLTEQKEEVVSDASLSTDASSQKETLSETKAITEGKMMESFTVKPLMQQVNAQPETQSSAQVQNNVQVQSQTETQPVTLATGNEQSSVQSQSNAQVQSQVQSQAETQPVTLATGNEQSRVQSQSNAQVQSQMQSQAETQTATMIEPVTATKETHKKTETKIVTQTQKIPVTWKLQGDTAFDSTKERIQDSYTYTAVLPKGYSVAEGVSIPVITVEITKKQVAFSQSITLDGIIISVLAGEGVLPEDAVLVVKKLEGESSDEKIASAIENSLTEKEQYVVVEQTYSFDIKITDRQGNEIQPDTSKGEVTVSFQNVESVKATGNEKSVEVFHVDDAMEKAEPVASRVKESEQTVEIDAKHFSIYTVALTRAAVTVFENDGYPYGMNMSSNGVTLVTEIAEDYSEDVKSVQWYYASKRDGNYTAISGATSLTYTFTPQVGNKYWYKCKVNGIETKPVQLLKASTSGSADIKPLRADTQWYVSNGTVAYTIWAGNTYFDVIGKYTKDGREYWINTSYGRKWKTKNQNIDALRFCFDESKPHLIGMEVKLASGETTYGFDADVMLADYSITAYSDSASLKAIYTGDNVTSVQMVGAASIDDAVETDPSFVLNYSTTPSYYWLGRYAGRKYNAYNTGNEGSNGVVEVKEVNGQNVVTEVAGIDSGMATTWTGIAAGGTVGFSFSIGSVAETGARIKATAEVSSDSVILTDLNTSAVYRLADESGSPVTDWLTPDSDGRLVISGLKSDAKYVVQAKPKNASDDKIQNVADVTTAIDPSKLTESEGEITCTATASSLTFANLNHNYAYQLMSKSEENGEEVYTAVTDWQNPEEGKGLTFNRLSPDTAYYLVAKSVSNTDSARREYRTNKAELKATATRRAQINLAVGSTSTDYSDFEERLREQLDGFNPENIAISALSASSASSTTSFAWNKYDHTNGSTSNATNKHFINVNALTSQSANDYNSKAYHIVENGSLLDFYGYGSSAYKDFYLYANDQTTRKEIEFKVTEGTAYDAFDGAGFLVNSSVTGNYTASTTNAQKLNGYLVFFQYSGSGTGQSIKVFQLINVNTYCLQQGMFSSFVFDSVSTVGTSYNSSYGTIKLIAQATTSYGNYKYRKVHIKVLPTYIQVWYSGGTSNSAQNVDLTANNANRDNYLLKWNVSGVSGAQDKISIDAVFDNGTSFRGGFGPLSSYRSHNCGQLTHFTMSDVNLDMDVVRSMTDIIRQPDWDSNFDSYLVNLNEAKVSDFSDTYSTAEIINRLIEDNVSYIGWGSNVNANDSVEFIDKLNVGGVRGTFINKQAALTSTYQSQIEAIANYIKSNTPEKQALESTIVSEGYTCRNYLYVLDEDWQIDGIDATLVDDNGWTITRSSIGLDYTDANGNLVIQPDKMVYATNANLDVNRLFRQRSGYYQIYRTSEYELLGNDAPVYLQVHTNEPPKAGVSTAVSGNKCTVTSSATDDIPGFEDAIMVTRVSDNVAIASNTVSKEEMTSTQSSNNLEFTFEKGVIYMIRQVIKDSDGSTTTISQMFSVNPDVCMKPYSSFAVNDTQLLTRRDTLTITDQSRAADDSLVTSEYVLQDSNGNYYKLDSNKVVVKSGTTKNVLVSLSSQESINDINLSNLETGFYTLSVTSKAYKNGATASSKTDPVSRVLNVTKGVKLSWNYNGGTLNGKSEEASRYVGQGVTVKLPDEEPVKEGYQFIGWSDGTKLYKTGEEVKINRDLIFGAAYKNTFTITVSNNWQYYYNDSVAGRCYDAAPQNEYPISSTLKLQWRLQGTTEWSDYSGRVLAYHLPFVVEETVRLEELEVTGSNNVTPYEYRVCQTESGKRQNYRSSVIGDNGQNYITAKDGTKTITVWNYFEPATFDVVIQASLSQLPELIKSNTENISLRAFLYYYSNETDGDGNANGWTKVQKQTEPIILSKGNAFRNTYGIWKWETEQPGDESKNTSYENSARLDIETSVWNGTEGLPEYLTYVYGEQNYQYGSDNQEPITITIILNEEYLSYDSSNNVITLNKDLELKNTLISNDDVTINLNGHKILGPAGKNAIEITNGKLSVIDLKGNGKIVGGAGVPGESDDNGGNGGNAIYASGNSSVYIGIGASVEGGAGAEGSFGNGGNGGHGVYFEHGSVQNDGNAAGGNGGNSIDGNGGDGGYAIYSPYGNIDNNGNATGGTGGDSKNGDGGNGGAGTHTDAGDNDNDGNSTGGAGGDSESGNGGNGGAGASSGEGDTNNSGTTTGGKGGNSESGNGGQGGPGASSGEGDTNNSGTTTGGKGGNSQSGGCGNGGAGISTETGDVYNAPGALSKGGNGGSSPDGNGGKGGAPILSNGNVQNDGKNVWGQEGKYVSQEDGEEGREENSEEDGDDEEDIDPEESVKEPIQQPVKEPDAIIEPSNPEQENNDEVTISQKEIEEKEISMGGESITSNELLESVSEVEVKEDSILAARGMSIEDAVVQIADPDKRDELITSSLDEGILKVSVENVNEKIVKGRFKDQRQIIEAIIAPEELVRVLAGTQMEVCLSITPVQAEDVNVQMKTMVTERQQQIGASLDVSLYKIINNTQKQKITQTNESISFVLDIPNELIKQNRVFSLYVEHETEAGEQEYFYLEDTDANEATITCVTNKLCTAILTYKDIAMENVNEQESIKDSNTEATKGDGTVLNTENSELSENLNENKNLSVLWILLVILVFTGIMMLIIRYRIKKK